MGRRRQIDQDPVRPVRKEFVPADPRCEECYYWRSLAGWNNLGMKCCHFCLDNGALRVKISETECGSFVERDTMPKRNPSYDDIPMTQWGCGGMNIFKR